MNIEQESPLWTKIEPNIYKNQITAPFHFLPLYTNLFLFQYKTLEIRKKSARINRDIKTTSHMHFSNLELYYFIKMSAENYSKKKNIEQCQLHTKNISFVLYFNTSSSQIIFR